MAEIVVRKKAKRKRKLFEPDTPMEIHYSETATVNLGNYESTKITFGVTVPVEYKDLEKKKDWVVEYVKDFIYNKVQEVRDEIE